MSRGTSFLGLPHDVLWCAFTFAPSSTWGRLNRLFYERFAHKWVRMRLCADRPTLLRFVERLRGRVEKLDLVSVDDESIDILQCLGNGACPGLWNVCLQLRDFPCPQSARTLNTILRGSDHVMTHFALEIQFPSGGAFTENGGLGVLLRGGVAHLHQLRSLHLAFIGCEMHDDACVGLVHALPPGHLPRLRSLALRLGHNDIGVVGTQALAAWIVALPELRDLEIDLVHNPCHATDVAREIGWAVSSLRLRRLTVRLFDRNPRTVVWRDAHRFPPCPSHNHTTLERIELDVGHVHSEDIVAWTDAMPNDITHLALHAGHPTHAQGPRDTVVECVVRDWNRFRRLRSGLGKFSKVALISLPISMLKYFIKRNVQLVPNPASAPCGWISTDAAGRTPSVTSRAHRGSSIGSESWCCMSGAVPDGDSGTSAV